MGVDTFLARHYEREALVIHRERSGYYDGLLPLHTLDELLSGGRIVQ